MITYLIFKTSEPLLDDWLRYKDYSLCRYIGIKDSKGMEGKNFNQCQPLPFLGNNLVWLSVDQSQDDHL